VITAAAAGDVLVVSYNLMLQAGQAFAARSWHTLIADESQAVKSQVLDDLPPRTELIFSVVPDADEAAHYEALRRTAVSAAQAASELRANGHKALVFSQFVDFLTLLRVPLDEAGIAYQYLDGSTPAAERTRRVAAFQAGAGDLFLISLKAGGFGLNLTAACIFQPIVDGVSS
jgi:SNF2 family DNA or RNA helicase